jgi:aspartyl protease family protein
MPASISAPGEKVLWRADDGLFYLDAQVNGRPVRFLVDTGASIVVLSAADAARIAPSEAGEPAVLADTAAGQREMRKVTLDQVIVAGRAASNVTAAVAGPELQVSLLGQNMIGYLGSVTIEGDRMTLR